MFLAVPLLILSFMLGLMCLLGLFYFPPETFSRARERTPDEVRSGFVGLLFFAIYLGICGMYIWSHP